MKECFNSIDNYNQGYICKESLDLFMTKFKHPLSFDALESLMSVIDKND